MALEIAYAAQEPDPEDVEALAQEVRDTLAHSTVTEHRTDSAEPIDWHMLGRATGQLLFNHQLEAGYLGRVPTLAPEIGDYAIRTAQQYAHWN